MPRIPRMLREENPTVYHVMSRTALDGYPLEDAEKDFLLDWIRKLSKLYFTDILGFSLMGNHFHLLVRMYPEESFSNTEVRKRVKDFSKGQELVPDELVPDLRKKLSSLSALLKDVKQGFTRYFNKSRKRSGFFWGQRFKSVIVEDGDTLINCLAYIDLNPIRAGIIDKPEDYRWNTLGYLLQTNNKDSFISLEFGLANEDSLSMEKRIEQYRRFVYEIGSLESDKGKAIDQEILKKEIKKGFQISQADRFKSRTRYFTDSGIIGSKKFVAENYLLFKDFFNSKNEKKPVPIRGLDDCYSLKRLSFFGY